MIDAPTFEDKGIETTLAENILKLAEKHSAAFLVTKQIIEVFEFRHVSDEKVTNSCINFHSAVAREMQQLQHWLVKKFN